VVTHWWCERIAFAFEALVDLAKLNERPVTEFGYEAGCVVLDVLTDGVGLDTHGITFGFRPGDRQELVVPLVCDAGPGLGVHIVEPLVLALVGQVHLGAVSIATTFIENQAGRIKVTSHHRGLGHHLFQNRTA